MAALFRQFLHRQETAGYSRWALNASAEVILTELEAETQRLAFVEDNYWAAKVTSLIRAKYTEPISTSSLAEELGLNPGLSPGFFASRQGDHQRLAAQLAPAHCKRAPQRRELSVAQVAEKVGIDDPATSAGCSKRRAFPQSNTSAFSTAPTKTSVREGKSSFRTKVILLKTVEGSKCQSFWRSTS